MPLEADDGKRSTLGVVVSLLDLGDGTCRVVLDDVHTDLPHRETSWHVDRFYTDKRFDARKLKAMSLPDSEYRAIGEAVVARLLALEGGAK